MEKTLSRIRNLRARRKLSLPASRSPGFTRNDTKSGDDFNEYGSVRITSLISDLHHSEIEGKGNSSERQKVVQWDPTVSKLPGRTLSEKSSKKKRSGSVSVISGIYVRNTSDDICDSYPGTYPYPHHGSLPHAFRNATRRHQLGKFLV